MKMEHVEDVCTCDVIQKFKWEWKKMGAQSTSGAHVLWARTERHGTLDGYEMERNTDEEKVQGRRVMKEDREECKR